MSKRLLICDDSSFSRKTILKSLPQDLDIAATETASGEEAVRACVDGEVDILFLDLNMPGMDGFEVLEKLKEQGFDRPVIVITANIQAAPAQRAKDLGARSVVQKPVDAQKLTTLMEYLIGEGAL